MKKYMYLSYPLDVAGPRPPAIPAPELTDLYSVEKDGAKVQIIKCANHTGTHLDTPRHVEENGLTVHDFAPEEFIFTRPALIELCLPDKAVVQPEHLTEHLSVLQKANIAIFRFGYGRTRRENPAKYSTDSPGFGIESAKFIRDNCPGLKALGLDVPSLACISDLERTMRAHNVLLGGSGRRFMVIEEMDLSRDIDGLTEVRINPWLVKDMDSCPCSVVGFFSTK